MLPRIRTQIYINGFTSRRLTDNFSDIVPGEYSIMLIGRYILRLDLEEAASEAAHGGICVPGRDVVVDQFRREARKSP